MAHERCELFFRVHLGTRLRTALAPIAAGDAKDSLQGALAHCLRVVQAVAPHFKREKLTRHARIKLTSVLMAGADARDTAEMLISVDVRSQDSFDGHNFIGRKYVGPKYRGHNWIGAQPGLFRVADAAALRARAVRGRRPRH